MSTVPIAVRAQKPMLADSGPATAAYVDQLGAGWLFDSKWDGIRAIAHVENGVLTLVNRRGTDITFRYPDLSAAFADEYAGKTLTLDGEIIVFDRESGRPEFKWAHQRDAFGPGRKLDIARWAQAYPATYVAFDCLYSQRDGDIRTQPLHRRLQVLVNHVVTSSAVRRSIWTTDGHQMLATVEQFGLEGTIAKRADSRYRAGRSSHWVKMKPKRSISALVTGWEAGEGWRAEYFGALTIAVYDEHGVQVDLGKVGSGFSRDDLNILDPLVKAQKPGDEPLIVIEVEYQERQPGTGVLRFPTFKGIRGDIEPAAATTAQFESGTNPPVPRVEASAS